jgi:hypothetical protein
MWARAYPRPTCNSRFAFACALAAFSDIVYIPQWVRLGQRTIMQRWTARLLLILLLVGVLAPVGLAATASEPHACCKRHPMHDAAPSGMEFHVPPGCCNHDCCRSLTVSHWADLGPVTHASCKFSITLHRSAVRLVHLTSAVDSAHSGRAPPQFLLG